MGIWYLFWTDDNIARPMKEYKDSVGNVKKDVRSK